MTPDLPAPIQAWRVMHTRHDTRLSGVVTVWPTRQMRARCLPDLYTRVRHHSRWPPCPLDDGHGRHGIYAYKTRRRARRYADKWQVRVVLASVLLWGRVAPHRDGYRATHARLTHLYWVRPAFWRNPGATPGYVDMLLRHDISLARRAADRYGLDLTLLDTPPAQMRESLDAERQP